MLKTISLRNIEYAVSEKPILQGVTFRCNMNERLCIFGENGAGKSTLLRIICGEIEADNGLLEKQGHIRSTYVPQEFGEKFNPLTVEEYLKIHAGEVLYKKIFNYGETLGFNIEKNLKKICKSLSGGQQKILSISTALAGSPDFLLLDEPENHLDIVSRMELTTALSDFKGGIIFISHDRLLIDALATKVGEVVEGKIYISDGGYEDYLEMKTKRIAGLEREFDAEAKRIRQLSSTIVILQQKAFRGKEVSAYRKAKEELDGLKAAHKESGRPADKKTRIRLSESQSKLHEGKLLCRIKGGMFKYPEAKHKTFGEVDLEVRAGDKIVLLGRNGSGKSTFLNCLTGKIALKSGELNWVTGVTSSYFDQHAEFDPEKNAIEVVGELLKCIDTEAQSALGAMKFDLARMKVPTKNLSGGERMRIRFAIAFGKKPDFLILDEPTNHIDEVTWEILLEACKKSRSSILLVTHDYEFIKEFNPTLFWMIHKEKIVPRYKELEVLLEELKDQNG